ncbi:DEKNAAC102635 [Brettanomyces naardenensis]|uniref:U6 snRNA phosphodiesterase 1 n=1 Tax=Brettanomyces naardenensis TaxID=13370 RepID=A0A448YKN1_BRENA|nr:DEKNAAC102635 [Brettanomyces naardenensis]
MDLIQGYGSSSDEEPNVSDDLDQQLSERYSKVPILNRHKVAPASAKTSFVYLSVKPSDEQVELFTQLAEIVWEELAAEIPTITSGASLCSNYVDPLTLRSNDYHISLSYNINLTNTELFIDTIRETLRDRQQKFPKVVTFSDQVTLLPNEDHSKFFLTLAPNENCLKMLKEVVEGVNGALPLDSQNQSYDAAQLHLSIAEIEVDPGDQLKISNFLTGFKYLDSHATGLTIDVDGLKITYGRRVLNLIQ